MRARSRSMIIVASSNAAICLFDVPTRVKYRPSAEYGASMPENATRMYALAPSSVRRFTVGEMGGSTLSGIQSAIWRIVASVASCPMISTLRHRLLPPSTPRPILFPFRQKGWLW